MNNIKKHPLPNNTPSFKRLGKRGSLDIYRCEKCNQVVDSIYLPKHVCMIAKKDDHRRYDKRHSRSDRIGTLEELYRYEKLVGAHELEAFYNRRPSLPASNTTATTTPIATLEQLCIIEKALLERLGHYKQPEPKTLDTVEDHEIPYKKRKRTLILL